MNITPLDPNATATPDDASEAAAKPTQRWKTTQQMAERYQLSIRTIANLTTDHM